VGIRQRHRLVRVLTAVATIGVLFSAAPADATTAQGVVYGEGTVTDDWGDEGPLSRTRHAYSGATGLWQYVLWADGAIESNGTTYDLADVDCNFGPNTEYATKNWQSGRGLVADGIVGPATLGRADNKLTVSGSAVTYWGDQRVIQIAWRGQITGTGWYDVVVPSGQGASFQATYSRPDYTPAPGGPLYGCWS
jgi:peptidoglycan hydrolase-like protein with peptidoglycan-binding domain